MIAVVLDASATLELLLATTAGVALRARLTERISLHAPHLIDIEIGQVLRRYVRSGELRVDRARMALEDLADLPIARYPHTPFLLRMWQLRNNVTFYDAAYLALAESLEARLLTCDERLAKAPGHSITIDVVG